MSNELEQFSVEWVNIKDLKPNPKNTNKHPKDQIERLASILKYQGWRWPIIAKKDYTIAAGEGRWLAAKHNKDKKVPVMFQEFIDEDQFKAFVTSDNAIASWAEIDMAMVNEELGSFDPSFDIDLLGLKDFTVDVAEKLEPGIEDDEVPENVETRCKPGDLWILGDHRLLCGDSTNIQHVERLMGGDKADMVFTDPPYGMFLDTDFSQLKNNSVFSKEKGIKDGKKYKPVIGDSDDFSPELINTIFSNFSYCKEIFIWGADYFSEHLPDKNNGSWLVWDKRLDEKFDKMYGSSFELCWSKSKHKREIIRVRWASAFGTEKEPEKKRFHPTQKPQELLRWFFEKYNGNSVVDLFGGSGSTLIACEKTKRKCYMMELDPHYCDVIIERWEKYSGKEARLDGQKEE